MRYALVTLATMLVALAGGASFTILIAATIMRVCGVTLS